jgi:hypothetical protein
VADTEIVKALRAERAIIARQVENTEANLRTLTHRLAVIDLAIEHAQPSADSQVRWGAAAYRRKQIV